MWEILYRFDSRCVLERRVFNLFYETEGSWSVVLLGSNNTWKLEAEQRFSRITHSKHADSACYRDIVNL